MGLDKNVLARWLVSLSIEFSTLKISDQRKYKFWSLTATDKKLEIDKKTRKKPSKFTKNLEIKLEIYKNLENKLEIYSYFKLENKLEIFEFFFNGR